MNGVENYLTCFYECVLQVNQLNKAYINSLIFKNLQIKCSNMFFKFSKMCNSIKLIHIGDEIFYLLRYYEKYYFISTSIVTRIDFYSLKYKFNVKIFETLIETANFCRKSIIIDMFVKKYQLISN